MEERIKLMLGDNMKSLKELPDNSVDSIVTDPPYALTSIKKRFGKEGSAPAQFGSDGAFQRASKGFMGKEWDAEVPTVEFWSEVYRVLKPGGHVLSFGGTRTYHRMAVNIEDAGFEIRDQIMWIYASGFPKSHNISKSLIKLADEKERTEQNTEHNLRCVPNSNLQETESIIKEQGKTLLYGLSEQSLSSSKHSSDTIWGEEPILEGGNNIQETEGKLQGSEIHKMSEGIFGDGEERWIHNGTQISVGKTSKQIIDEDGSSPSHRPQPIKQSNRKSNVVSQQLTSQEIREAARKYNNYGSALKPANEPICLARKPLSEKSIAENVLKHGTGGINIDDCRISHSEPIKPMKAQKGGNKVYQQAGRKEDTTELKEEGRFPANIIFDEEAGKLLDEQSGPTSQGHWSKTKTTGFGEFGNGSSTYEGVGPKDKNKEKQGASRFFYVPKVSKKERNRGLDDFEAKTNRQKGHGLDRICGNCGTSMLKPQDCKCEEPDWITPPKKNTHPTVKPINLLTYLVRLVTPKNGVVMDCFMGSGSTGIAAQLEGFKFIGMEMDEDYFNIAETRINAYEEYRELLK
jgi:DNA modification methylase